MAQILHIQADRVSGKVVSSLLTAAGHQVIGAKDGLEGTLLAKSQHPDLVLVDTDVSELDGYEVTLRLRGMDSMKRVPIVAISAEADLGAALAVGADGLIEKPVDPGGFVAAVEQFLAGHSERTLGADESMGEQLRSRSQKIVERLEHKVSELREANRRLQEMARLRREFLRNLSHEFATPMTPVVGYLRLLLTEEMGPLTPLQRKCIQSIDNSTHKLRALVDTLLDVSALEMGRLHLYERDYDFAEVVERAVAETEPMFAGADISLLREEVSESLPARGDPDKLCRAMLHILDNALKFTPRGGEVAVGIRSRRSQGGGDDEYQFLVVDNGPGISEQERKRILEPFYQADGSPTRAHGGVGLGLAFARHVAESMGGAIEIQSPPAVVVAGRELSGTAFHLSVKSQGRA